MTTQQQILTNLNVQAAETFVYNVQNNDDYYVYIANHLPFVPHIDGGTDNNPPVPQDTTQNLIKIYDNLLFGKRVKPDQVANMIRRIEWVNGTVYAMYSDNDTDLDQKNFYVTVDDTVEINVYKCLYNNNGAQSTQRPFGKSLDPIEFPQDGYIWKYMFTVDGFRTRQFATLDYIPVVEDANVAAAATAGSIDIIVADDGGIGYGNYTSGIFTDPTAIAVGSNVRFALQSNASDKPGFYNNCLIKMISGAATGEYRTIVDYVIDNGRKIIVIDKQFQTRPNPGDQYEIFPRVFVTDVSGTSTKECIARAIISPDSGNTVSRIEVLATGENYRVATAEIRAANIVAVTAEASIRPILAPPGGHGSNVNNELFAYYAGITASFSGNAEPLIANNDFRSIGIIRNPLYANVEVLVDSTTTVGAFQRGERVFRYRPIKLTGTADLFADGLLVGTNTAFLDTLRTGDAIILHNGLTNFYAKVQTINTDTELVLDRSPGFDSSNNTVILAQGQYFGTVTGFRTGVLTLTSVVPRGFDVSTFLVGEKSSTTTMVDNNVQPNIKIGERQASDFEGFIQLTRLVGTFTSPTRFIQDEQLFQDHISEPVAVVHSFVDNPGTTNDLFYASNVTRNLRIRGENGSSGIIRGGTSNATFIVQDKYDGEIVVDSGEILYVENLSPITRDVRQTETLKLILEF